MRSFKEFLLEKLIVLNNGAKYGQIVIVLGGTGSGKGFAISNFLENDKFKSINVDDWKEAFLKLCQRNKIEHPELCKLSLANKSDVAKLHQIIKDKGIKDKILDLLFSGEKAKETLPNLLFDITGKDFSDISEVAELAKGAGYDVKNIHVVYVLTQWKTAYQRNISRSRVVGGGIFIETHRGATQTLQKIVDGQLSSSIADGAINVILNNPENTEFYKGSKNTVKNFTYINLKKSSQPIKDNEEIISTIEKWIKTNAPQSAIKQE